MFAEVALNSALYAQNIVQPVLFIFLLQEGNLQFQLKNAYQHDACATRHDNFPSRHQACNLLTM